MFGIRILMQKVQHSVQKEMFGPNSPIYLEVVLEGSESLCLSMTFDLTSDATCNIFSATFSIYHFFSTNG